MSQLISLQQAVEMTTLYRNEKESILLPTFQNQNILAICETFNRDVFDAVLAQPDCEGVRIYYGMDKSLKVHAIIVGVNSNNEDILPPVTGVGGGQGDIIEDGARCPDLCPPFSPLNP